MNIRYCTLIFSFLFILARPFTLVGQTTASLFNAADSIKTIYGQNDVRYLNALTIAIQSAYDDGDFKTAYTNRKKHCEIVKAKYGDESLEYAEDLFRLGNVSSRYIGTSSGIKNWLQSASIYEKLGATDNDFYLGALSLSANAYVDTGDFDVFYELEVKFLHHLAERGGDNIRQIGIDCISYSSFFIEKGKFNELLEVLNFAEQHFNFNSLEKEDGQILALCCGAKRICYANLAEYTNAIKYGKKASELYKQYFGPESIEYGQSIILISYSFPPVDDYDDALNRVGYLIDGISILEKIYKRQGLNPAQDDLYVNALSTAASIYAIGMDYEKELPYLIKLDEVYTSLQQNNTKEYLENLGNILLCYNNLHLFDDFLELGRVYEDRMSSLNLCDTDSYVDYLLLKIEAQTFLYKTEEANLTALELQKKIINNYGEYSFKNLMLCYQLGNLYESLDKHADAQSYLDKCLQIIEKGGTDLFDSTYQKVFVSSSLHNLQGMIFTATEPDKAEDVLLLSLDEKRSINAVDAAALVNLGVFYYQHQREPRKALRYFEEANSVFEQNGENTLSVQYISNLLNIALCNQELGQTSIAISTFDYAEDKIIQEFGTTHPLLATILQNKSMFYAQLTDYESAIKYGQDALQLFAQVYGEDSEKYAIMLQNLGQYYQWARQFDEAEQAFLKAIPLLRTHSSPYIVAAYTNLNGIYGQKKDFESCKKITNEAAAIIVENHWEETDFAASFVGNVGYILAVNNDPSGKEYLGQALGILERAGQKNTITYLSGLTMYGLSLFNDGSQTEEFIPILFASYKNQYLSNTAYYNSMERESLVTGPRVSQIKNILFSSRSKGKYDDILYDYILFTKGLLLGTNLSIAKSVYDLGDDDLINKYGQLQLLNRRLKGDPTIEKELSDAEIRKMASSLEREITTRLRDYSAYTDDLDVGYKDVISSLNNKEAAVEFLNYRNCIDNSEYYAAMVVRSDIKTPQYISLCSAEELAKYTTQRPDKLYSDGFLSDELYRAVWAPIIPYLKSIKKVYFSPAGLLHRLAIENISYSGKRISEDYEIERVSSTREITRKRDRYKYTSAILYGGLTYDEDDELMINESRSVRGQYLGVTDSPRGWAQEGVRKGWQYLPGSLSEVKGISSVMSDKMSHILLSGSKGNEESFKALSGQHFSILHIATHGFYMNDRQADKNTYIAANPFINNVTSSSTSALYRSGLLLSGANKAWKGEAIPDGVEDGVLSAAEISDLDFNSCDIVVLSACETGLGDITDEGVFGLQRSFKNAGVNTIIMSLWEVDDAATSLMMQSFYKTLLRGKDKRTSFEAARNEVKKQFSDPRYWAAFIMLD